MYEQPISIQQPQENYNMQDLILYHNKRETSLDDNTQGVVNPNGQTATETVAAQTNASLLAQFGNLLDYLAEAELMFKWQRMKAKSLKRKQIVTVINPLGEKAITYTTQDLKIGNIDRVIIKSKNQVEREEMIKLQKKAQLLPFVQEFGGFPYRKFVRDLSDAITGNTDESELYVPLMPEELEAKEQIALLNDNIDLAEVTDIEGEDHHAYLAWYRMADDTPARAKAIQARLDAQAEKQKRQKIAEKAASAAAGNASGAP